MKIKVIPVSIEHMTEVVDILQLISEFKPKNSYYEDVFKEFLEHSDNYGFVAVDDVKKVLGFGSILIEYKMSLEINTSTTSIQELQNTTK